MSNVLKYKTATGYAEQYLLSVHTPDYQASIGNSSFLINPKLDNVQGVPIKYWKVSGGFVVEMSQAEKDAVDAAEPVPEPSEIEKLSLKIEQLELRVTALENP